jgi:lipoprotein signal peptidase
MKTLSSLLLSVILGSLDLAVKFWILKNFQQFQPVEVFGEFLRINLVMNPNTAFGISLGENFPYAPVAIALALFVLYLLVKEKDTFSKLMYSLILAGAIGNITDRIINGAVVDFIDVGIGNLRWFTFNLADIFVSLGIIGLIVKGFFVKDEGVRSYGGVRERAYDSSEGN